MKSSFSLREEAGGLEIYFEIQRLVEECCRLKCGKVPEAESDCKGKNTYVECPLCHGNKIILYYSRRWGNRSVKCSRCGGTGKILKAYTCPARRISDNADYHREMRRRSYSWMKLLEEDLIGLKEVRQKLIEERLKDGLFNLFHKEESVVDIDGEQRFERRRR